MHSPSVVLDLTLLKFVCIYSLLFTLGPIAAASPVDMSPWAGTYAEVDSSSGRVRAAVRIAREGESFVAYFWKYGVIRRIGEIRPGQGPSTTAVDAKDRVFTLSFGAMGERRVLAVGSEWTILLNAGESLSEDPLRRSMQYNLQTTSRIAEGRLSFESFVDGVFTEPAPFSACELELMRD